MPLDSHTQSLPFVQGPDTKSDPKLATKPSRLENAVFRGGSIQKRWGRAQLTSAIATGGVQNAGNALFTFGEELVRINTGTTYGLSETQNDWVAKQATANYGTLSLQERVNTTSVVFTYDYAEANGVGVIAYTRGGTGLYVLVFDVQTGTIYQGGDVAVAAAGFQGAPRCLLLGTTVVILVAQPLSGLLLSTFVSTTSPLVAPPSLTTLRSDFYTSGVAFDACVYSAAYGVVVYPSNLNSFKVFAVGPAGTAIASPAAVTLTAVTTNAGTNRGVYVQRDTAGSLYVVFGDGAAGVKSTRFTVLNAAFGVVVAATNLVTTGNWSGLGADMAIAAGIEVTTNQLTLVMASQNVLNTGSAYKPWLGTAVLNASGVVTAFSEIPSTQGLCITSDLVPWNGTFVFAAVNVTHTTTPVENLFIGLQTTAFFLTYDGKSVARTLESASSLPIDSGLPIFRASRAWNRDGQAIFTLSSQGRFNVLNTPLGLTQATLTPAATGSLPIQQLGETLYIGGALPRTLDGRQVTDAGFPLYPEVITTTTTSTGGALSDGTYQYACLWSWLNAQGELVRSVVGPPTTVTLSAGTSTQKVVLRVATMPLSMRDLLPVGASVVLEAYRTTNAGTVFYSLAVPGTPILNATAFVGTTTGLLSFPDASYTDATLQANELLYTTGNVLDWDAPPAYGAAFINKGRLIVLPLDAPFNWWPSDVATPGEQLRFSTFTGNTIPADTGPLVAGASLDGNLILFTTSAAYLVSGDGPDQLGNNPYPLPQRIASVDSGPIGPQSVIETPLGIMYQSNNGITLLDRSLNTQLIGADVIEFSTGAWVVRNAFLNSNEQEIRFLADPGSDLPGAQTGTLVPGNGGVCLVYNYFYNQWSVFPAYGGQDACYYQGNYTMVRSDGVVWQEQPGTFTDANTYYPMLVETAWIKVAGLQGFQRLYYVSILGTYGSDFTVQWDTAYSYASTAPAVPVYSETVTLNGVGVFALGGQYQVRHHLGKKCEAVKFRFQDTLIAGNGMGLALSDLSFEYGIKKGVFRLPAAQTA